MTSTARSLTLGLLVFGCLALLASGCGSSGSGGARAAADDETLVDLQNFSGGEPDHLDPALADTLQSAQVPWLLYQRLTDTDVNGKVVAEAAEPGWKVNADSTQFVFTLKKGLKFSNGEDVTPTSFKKAWERVLQPALASTLAYHLLPIKGATEVNEGKATDLTGVTVDDNARTITINLVSPFADFAAVVSHTVFSPLPKVALDLKDPTRWEQGAMIGNGPYTMTKGWEHNREVDLVANDKFAGGPKAKIKNLQMTISKDVDSQYSAFRAGKGDTAYIPPGKFKEATTQYKKNLTEPLLNVYKFEIGQDNPNLGGDKNEKLRQAISVAIDRNRINQQVYNGSREDATGLTPPKIPGYRPGLCHYCTYNVDEAKRLLQEWGGDPAKLNIKIGTNTGSGHEPVVAIIVENLKAVGITAELDPLNPDTWTDDLKKPGGCQLCRSSWAWDYPVYDNVLSSQYLTSSIGSDNYSRFSNPDFDRMIADARATKDQSAREAKYRAAETFILDRAITVPINWYRGQVVIAPRVDGLQMTPLSFVTYQTASLNK